MTRSDAARNLAQASGQSQHERLTRRILVVGNGMVGHRFCDELIRHDKESRYTLTVVGEEASVAYDRVHLTDYMTSRDGSALGLATTDWYKERGIELLLGERVTSIDFEQRIATTSVMRSIAFDHVVFCTGSRPFVPPISGIEKPGVFVYRTLEDLDGIIERAASAKRAVVLGGGLLGLEAAKAVSDIGLETEVVEFAPRLMPRQLDKAGANLLTRAIESLGIRVHVAAVTTSIEGKDGVEALKLEDGQVIETDIVVVSAGIRPRDELASAAGIEVHPKGGIIIDDALSTNIEGVFAIGECALHHGVVYGLVGPGYAMAEKLAKRLTGDTSASFTGADTSTKLKLLGVDVASFGDPFADAGTAKTVSFEDHVRGTYKKLIVSEDCSRLIGGILVGDAAEYTRLLAVVQSDKPLDQTPEELLMGSRQAGSSELSAEAVLCSCNHVSAGCIRHAVRGGCDTVNELKESTRAGSGCGGCLGLVKELLDAELAAAGKEVRKDLCEHFRHSRQELFEILSSTGARSFEEILSSHGSGNGCEICKPTVASILASVHNDLVINHASIQDTNDRFLANIQRGGLYSVVPRIPGGEVTPEKLIVLGRVAQKYGLYTKITGGQRIDLFGARLDQLPEIWEELIDAGFESGHAYGKALRTVKSCVGSSWCRFGVQDSVGFAIRVENRYKGIRAPHKLKSAVSGCTRECAEARSKDFGLIATDKGYNLYVCGNGGMNPRHADLLASDLDEETALKYIDRFLVFYIRTADRLTRTSKWLESLPGGIEHLRSVVVEDSLGIAESLEAEMDSLVASYQCEWKAVVENDDLRRQFRHFENGATDEGTSMVLERGQRRPADWPSEPLAPPKPRHLPVAQENWVPMGRVSDFQRDAGLTFRYGAAQIAIFNYASRGEWYATQAQCPHKGDMVLGRGLVGDSDGVPKVACPHHKKCFSLGTGECLTKDSIPIKTFPVRVEGDAVLVALPPLDATFDLVLKSEGCSEASEASAESRTTDVGITAAPTERAWELQVAPTDPAE